MCVFSYGGICHFLLLLPSQSPNDLVFYEHDLDILKMCLHTIMMFLGQHFQKLVSQTGQAHTQTHSTKKLPSAFVGVKKVYLANM